MTVMTDSESIKLLGDKFRQLKAEIGRVIVGQDQAVDSLLTAIFSGGHCLLLGVPGLAKTLMVNTLAQCLGLEFSRIQFTPDLMPSDITGSEVLDDSRTLKFMKGPVFANIVLADEINRTPPKTQAALLEAMQERMVTANGVSYKLSNPFFVLATQNPIEQEGTYPLPEAQLDRFMLNVKLDYPSFDEEVEIVKRTTVHTQDTPSVVMTADEIVHFQQVVRKMPVADNVYRYAVTLVAQTRPHSDSSHAKNMTSMYLSWGAGPRASQYLIMGAKTHAALSGKFSPDIEDVQAVALEVLRHRIVRNYYAEAEGISTDTIINELMKI